MKARLDEEQETIARAMRDVDARLTSISTRLTHQVRFNDFYILFLLIFHLYILFYISSHPILFVNIKSQYFNKIL